MIEKIAEIVHRGGRDYLGCRDCPDCQNCLRCWQSRLPDDIAGTAKICRDCQECHFCRNCRYCDGDCGPRMGDCTRSLKKSPRLPAGIVGTAEIAGIVQNTDNTRIVDIAESVA